MKHTLEAPEVPAYLAPSYHAGDWTAVIPAAGRGSRLGFNRPKILYPLAGRSILSHLSALLRPRCAQAVVVLSPDGAVPVEPELRAEWGERASVAIQAAPVGMADAVDCGLRLVSTAFTLVVWGDQVALRPETVDTGMRLLEGPLAPNAVCPTGWRQRPYIHFERNAAGQLVNILQAREEDILPDAGESDTGLFLFRTAPMRQALQRLRQSGQGVGAKTGEQSFLFTLPLLDAEGAGVCCPRIAGAGESLGLNAPEDVAVLEAELGGRATAPAGNRTW
jgi:bifunctional UDP-N-acetylglucosamine pyrophosphorylase/glucosamine-1-phosphate N-acetyltransferase